MELKTIVILLGVLTALLTLLQGYDWWKKRQSKSSIDVVNSAMQLLKPYQEEAESLRKNLEKANDQILDLSMKLNAAQTEAKELSTQLVDAQAEVGYLRTQVRILSQQLSKDDSNGTNRS